MPKSHRRGLLALGTALLFVPFQAVLAQGGRPSFPPGLHDRTLPPGRPFDGGAFNPPGHGRGVSQLSEEEAVVLEEYLSDSTFASSHTLRDAVAAFNGWVLRLSADELRSPPPEFLETHRLLSRHLGLEVRTGSWEADGRVRPPGNLYAAGLVFPAGARLQLEELRSVYLLPLPPRAGEGENPWTSPGMAAATPVGFGADFGVVWAGASYQNQLRYSDKPDGAAAIGFGLGDARRWVGLQVAITSFSTVESGWGDRTAVDLHLHRTIGGRYGLAVGWESVRGSWKVTRDSGENFYAVASSWLRLRSDPSTPFGEGMVSLGVGTGRFQTEPRFLERADGVGVFGSFGVRVAPPVSLIAEWTGQDLLLATSLTPLRNQRVAVTAGFADVTGTAGDGARFVLGGSLGYDFRGR